jgi:hypothetical protein
MHCVRRAILFALALVILSLFIKPLISWQHKYKFLAFYFLKAGLKSRSFLIHGGHEVTRRKAKRLSFVPLRACALKRYGAQA